MIHNTGFRKNNMINKFKVSVRESEEIETILLEDPVNRISLNLQDS
jgi:hypothetical protein